MLGSERLPRALGAALAAGNAVNAGTAMGGALGVRMDSLARLRDFRVSMCLLGLCQVVRTLQCTKHSDCSSIWHLLVHCSALRLLLPLAWCVSDPHDLLKQQMHPLQ